MLEKPLQPSSLLDELPDLVLVTDSEGLIHYANHCSRMLLGQQYLPGTSFFELISPLDTKWFPKSPQGWIALQGDDDTEWEVRLTVEAQPQLVNGKARKISIPVESSTSHSLAIFEGVLVVLRPAGKAIQQIRRSLLIKAIASVDSSIVIADMLQADRPLSYVNQGFLNATGYEASEVLGRNCRFLQSAGSSGSRGDREEDRESLEQIKAAIAAGEKTCVTLKNYRKDGTLFYNELRLAPVYENGQLSAYVGVQNDVTERVRSQQQLLERERTLSSFLSAAEPLMGIVEFSQAAFPQSDFSKIDLSRADAIRHVLTNADDREVGKRKAERSPRDSTNVVFASLGLGEAAQASWKAAFERCLQTQKVVKFEYETIDQQQRRYFRATINLVSTEPEAAIRCCYIAEEITRLVETEERRSLMEAAVENIDESVVITGSDLEKGGPSIVYVNKAFTQITGYTAAEAIGQTPRILQGEMTNPSVLNRLKEGLVTNQSFEGEVINYRKDGKPFVLEWSIAPVTDDQDQVAYWVAAQQDVTRRRQLEKEVLESQTKEQERIARDLHDSVQQRLTVIGGLAKVVGLKLGDDLPPQVGLLLTKLLEASKQAASEVRAITHGLHSVSKAEDGLMRSLQQLAITTQEVLNIDCEFFYEQPVLIDDYEKASHLYRLAQEAVNNAIRHGQAKQILIALSQTAPDRYTLTISDNGCGISKAALAPSAGGLGLNSMRYRAEIIGAEFAIAPNGRGRGTIVTCTFACQNATSKTGQEDA